VNASKTRSAPLISPAAGAARSPLVVQQAAPPYRWALALSAAQGLHRIGRAGAAGLAMLAVSLGVVGSTILPLRRQVDVLQEQLRQVRVNPPPRTGARPASEELDDFVRSLPARGNLPGVVSGIAQQAQEAGLELTSGRYELIEGRGVRILQYRLTFPVKGTYPQVRRFVELALQAAPAAALQSLRMRREDISQGFVQTDVTFVIYVGGSV
jgi:hypothetical protein